MFTYRATVQHIVDADTVDFDVDLGFGVRALHRFRLLGLDAPERFTPEGKLATEHLASILPVGQVFEVRTHKARTDKYGRYLAEVMLPGGLTATEDMIAKGFGVISRFAIPKD